MTVPNAPAPPAQIAVWYFVGATFAFALPNLLYPDMVFWMRILFFVVGAALMIAGGVRLGQEIAARRAGRGPDGENRAPGPAPEPPRPPRP